MIDFKLKLALSILSGIIFSFIFIILALAAPIREKDKAIIKKPKGNLEKISHSLQTR